jgi:predicted ArsR family transcriptional regulator
MSAPVTINEVAAQLHLTRRQIRYALDNGAPALKSGGKGRGRATLIDVAKFADWLAVRGRPTEEDGLTAPRERIPEASANAVVVARDLVQAVAMATAMQFRTQTGPHKRALLESLLRQFEATVIAIHEQLGLPPLPAEEFPDAIKQMAKTLCLFYRAR